MDVAYGSQKLISSLGYNVPELLSGKKSKFVIKKLRHPIAERAKACRYIPHDLELGGAEPSGLCLFAPNAAGKSTLMAALGLSTIMAQAGFPVPCEKFSFVPVDGIYTRINALDRLGVSSFVAEMIQLRSILHRSTKRSLVLSDEACNMTETISAQSICVATLDRLSNRQCTFMFSTHLHELASAERVSAIGGAIRFAHLGTDISSDGEIVYTREIKNGPGEPVYGLRVARHILRDPDFWDVARSVQKSLLGRPKHRVARYNGKVFLGICEICRDSAADHAHHIKYQKNADKNGMHGVEHKNAEHNLVGLCASCHDNVHSGKVVIRGWMMTTGGRRLRYAKVVKKVIPRKIN
jgi:DNA mismatch repair protein MutS